MIPRLVVDASAILTLCFENENAAYANKVLAAVTSGARDLVPAIWPLELANCILVAERKGRLDTAVQAKFLRLLGGLSADLDGRSVSDTMNLTLPLARKHHLTAYDAAYLELAIRHDCPIASLDRQLVQACATTGVPVL